jgi:hypothetical protein
MHEVSTKIGGHLVMAADDQKLRVKLVGRNGRRRYEAASKERLVTACLGIEACTRTRGQREPPSEVDQENDLSLNRRLVFCQRQDTAFSEASAAILTLPARHRERAPNVAAVRTC